MNTDRFVTRKLEAARREDNPHTILRIAAQLEKVSAWEEARECERLAEAAERKLAEAVNK